MSVISTILIWSWILGVALFIPTTLPAGGAQKATIRQRQNVDKSPLIALKAFHLLSAVSEESYVLDTFNAGTPVEVLKVWETPNNGKWLYVSVLTNTSDQLFYKRGWVNVGTQ